MGNQSVGSRSVAPAALAFLSVFVFFAAILPSAASAQTTSVTSLQPQQLLPPGQNTCQPVTVTNVQPYVYGGVLESFDVTISDTSGGYVGVFGTAGNSQFSLDSISRWQGTPSGLRVHVDVQDVRVGSMLPVSLTMLSSLPNQPTCITTISFDVSGSGTIAPNSTSNTGSGSTSTSVPSQAPQGTGTASSMPVSVATSASVSHTGGTVATSSKAGTSTGAIAATASANSSGFFSSVCSGSNAYRLWLVLLVLYIIIVAIVVFAEPWFLETSVLSSTAAILVPLILLLVFWYLSSECRAASWIPVVACIIAIVGLFLAFREYELPPLLPAPTDQ